MTVEFNHRNYAIASYLVHGHTPWGHPLDHKEPPSLTRYQAPGEPVEWIMCCNHYLSGDEQAAWTAADLAVVQGEGATRLRLVAGPEIGNWLADCWTHISGDYERAIAESEAA